MTEIIRISHHTLKKQTSAYLRSYEYIRDKILNGELRGGTKLVEERFAEELGVSRTPIREAIRKLEDEGLIKRKKVVIPTETDLRNMFQVRMLLEGYASRCAASYMSDENLNKMKKSITTAKNGSTDEILLANKEFHDLIIQASNNPIMIEMIDRMQSIIYLFSRTVILHKRPFLIDEHEQIYIAILSHQPDQAENFMKKHLQADLEFYLHLYR